MQDSLYVLRNVACLLRPLLELSAHRRRPCTRTSSNSYSSRSATAMGLRAALTAGSRPPIRPIASAKNMPLSRRPGVIRKANARFENVCQLMVLVVWPLRRSTAKHPSTPPMKAISKASIRNENTTAGPPKPSAHGGNFATALGHRGVHGIERAENRADGHDECDQAAEDGDEARHGGGLLGVVINFTEHIQIQARVGADGILELLQSGRGSEVHRGRLIDVGGALVHVVEYARVRPYLGIERAAARVKNADDAPVAAAELHGIAKRQAGVGFIGVRADDQFGQARLKHLSLNDFDVAAYCEHIRRNAAHLDVGVGSGGAQRKGSDHDDLGSNERT